MLVLPETYATTMIVEYLHSLKKWAPMRIKFSKKLKNVKQMVNLAWIYIPMRYFQSLPVGWYGVIQELWKYWWKNIYFGKYSKRIDSCEKMNIIPAL